MTLDETEKETDSPLVTALENACEVQERPFTSQTPVVGPFIARFREVWNSVSTKWYVRPLLHQQNVYNRIVAQTLTEVLHALSAVRQSVSEMAWQQQELDTRLIESDRDATDLARQVAELTYAVVRLEKRLAELERMKDEG